MNKEVILYSRTGYELINKGASDNAMTMYIALRSLYNPSMEEMVISADSIYYQLYNDMLPNRATREIKDITDGLKELENLEVIKIKDTKANRFVIDMSNLYQEVNISIDDIEVNPFTGEIEGNVKKEATNYFIKIELSDIQNLLKDKSISKTIISYLFFMLNKKAENNDNYFFTTTRDELAYSFGCDIRTIDKYNKALEENNIIYVHRYDYKYTSTGLVLNNVYGLYEHKAIIQEICNKYIAEMLKENKVILSKTYANKGKNTKIYKENIKKKSERKANAKVKAKENSVDDF